MVAEKLSEIVRIKINGKPKVHDVQKIEEFIDFIFFIKVLYIFLMHKINKKKLLQPMAVISMRILIKYA